MKLSIIIPCYNSAEFIEECLESVLPNIQSDMEVIVVNDGSTDNSNDIIIKIAHRYPDKNLIIINQDNAGLSAARNKGLSIASGEYISLLDSDDLFDQKFWSEVPHLLNDSSIDIIEFNAEQFENELSNIVEHIDCAVFSGKKSIYSIEQLKPAFQRCKWYPWARVYKKSLFLDNNIEFPDGRLYEDMSTIPALYLKYKCIFGINKSLVWYRFHKKSITQTFRQKDISDLVYVATKLSSLSKENSEAIKIIFPTIQRIFNFIKYNLVKNKHAKFSLSEQRTLQKALMSFISEFKLSRKIQILILPVYLNTLVRIRKNNLYELAIPTILVFQGQLGLI
ncbi:putative glycosyltransferase [Buttiauxella noackiae ATCC 51607]|uniref:Putative glycosyltransferase n=1 Tax=Buttiauxella noackiae ATCC 51607 TaxID=1354255 RepID=A0A1B7HV14_9ENTR|nr:glycosyltransferase [Buttiauxella noackiae]OAT19480.1 putative glycosyltransferase [Buttiauxella noackiae ATCC 51607]